MLFTDIYKTIEKASQSDYRDRGSKFLGFAYPVKSDSEVKDALLQLRKQYYDATHHCYAYIIGPNSEQQRANDDGEPANSAGKPIQRAIQSKGLTNVLVVVVRYFGGKLLGVPGLINAYGNTALDALNHAKVIEKIVEEVHNVTFDYPDENTVFKILKQGEARILNIEKTEKCVITFASRMSKSQQLSNALKESLSLHTEFQYVQ